MLKTAPAGLKKLEDGLGTAGSGSARAAVRPRRGRGGRAAARVGLRARHLPARLSSTPAWPPPGRARPRSPAASALRSRARRSSRRAPGSSRAARPTRWRARSRSPAGSARPSSKVKPGVPVVKGDGRRRRGERGVGEQRGRVREDDGRADQRLRRRSSRRCRRGPTIRPTRPRSRHSRRRAAARRRRRRRSARPRASSAGRRRSRRRSPTRSRSCRPASSSSTAARQALSSGIAKLNAGAGQLQAGQGDLVAGIGQLDTGGGVADRRAGKAHCRGRAARERPEQAVERQRRARVRARRGTGQDRPAHQRPRRDAGRRREVPRRAAVAEGHRAAAGLRRPGCSTPATSSSRRSPGPQPADRNQAASVVNLKGGGTAGMIMVVPKQSATTPVDPRARRASWSP